MSDTILYAFQYPGQNFFPVDTPVSYKNNLYAITEVQTVSWNTFLRIDLNTYVLNPSSLVMKNSLYQQMLKSIKRISYNDNS